MLRAKRSRVQYTESDKEVFGELLKDPSFMFHPTNLDNFLEYFFQKGWLQEEIKSHLQANAYFYG